MLAVVVVLVFLYVEKIPSVTKNDTNAPQDASKIAVDKVLKEAKPVSAVDITACKPSPAVAPPEGIYPVRLKINSKVDFKNSDAKAHDISFSPTHTYKIPAKGKLTITFNFYKFPGIRNYTCDFKPAGSIVITK